MATESFDKEFIIESKEAAERLYAALEKADNKLNEVKEKEVMPKISMNELRPCPFCGSKVTMYNYYPTFAISCVVCPIVLQGENVEKLINKWNTRI